MADANLASLFDHHAKTGSVDVPEHWRQGRTAYGGLSAALAFHAARASLSEAPPLRSGQIAFVGPLSGCAATTTSLLRRGRSAAFVAATLSGDDGLALDARFVFGAARESAVAHMPASRPAEASIPAGVAERSIPQDAPAFFRNFAMAHAVPREAVVPGDVIQWVRLARIEGLDDITTPILLGDGLPPAAFGLVSARGPISSMTWQFDLLTDRPTTDDGWWLLRSTITQARDGFSSQTMAAWNTAGEQVLSGMQTVALFL